MGSARWVVSLGVWAAAACNGAGPGAKSVLAIDPAAVRLQGHDEDWTRARACAPAGVRIGLSALVLWGGPRYEKPRVEVTDSAVTIQDKIYFRLDSAEIDPKSYGLLDEIAAAVVAHPDIELLEVAGHADEQGTEAHNLVLTRARAGAVAKYLVAHGVATIRLRPAGYGAYCPVDPARNDAAYEKNRRVEFPIAVRAGKPVKPGWGGCAAAEAHGLARPSAAVAPAPAPAPAPPPLAAGGCSYTYPATNVDVGSRPLVRPFGPRIGEPTLGAFEARQAEFERTLCRLATPGVVHGTVSIDFGWFYLLLARELPDADPRQRKFIQRALDLTQAGSRELEGLAASSDAKLAEEARADLKKRRYQRGQPYYEVGLFDAWRNIDDSRTVQELWVLAEAEPAARAKHLARLIDRAVGVLDPPKFAHCTVDTLLGARAMYEVGDRATALRTFEFALRTCDCRSVSTDVPQAVFDLVPPEARRPS